MSSVETIMQTINSLPREEKWPLIYSLRRAFDEEEQREDEQSEPFMHYMAVIEANVQAERNSYKLTAKDYADAKSVMSSIPSWCVWIVNMTEQAHILREKEESKTTGMYPYTGPFDAPIKNVSVALNKTESENCISVTVSWDSWQIEKCYMESQIKKSLIDCYHYYFRRNTNNTKFNLGYALLLKEFNSSSPDEE